MVCDSCKSHVWMEIFIVLVYNVTQQAVQIGFRITCQAKICNIQIQDYWPATKFIQTLHLSNSLFSLMVDCMGIFYKLKQDIRHNGTQTTQLVILSGLCLLGYYYNLPFSI